MNNHTESQIPPSLKWPDLPIWVAIAVLAIVFVVDGVLQCVGQSFLAPVTSVPNAPSWLSPAVGAIEIGAGALLLLAGATTFAASCLAVVMVAGVLLQVRFTGGLAFIPPLLLLAGLAVIGYERSTRIRSIRRLRSAVDIFAEAEILREQLRRDAANGKARKGLKGPKGLRNDATRPLATS